MMERDIDLWKRPTDQYGTVSPSGKGMQCVQAQKWGGAKHCSGDDETEFVGAKVQAPGKG